MAKKRAKTELLSDSSRDNSEDRIEYVSISEETRRRYLNYAMSVIMSRALPDVRDGLKPVQRRILYVMYHDLRLLVNGKTRKCSKIVGDTTGNYHPHGDVAVYEALVRLAQNFNMREPLVMSQGNFGSVMGLKAAASRYTEAKLTSISEDLMGELRFQTVDYRPNYDASRDEPVVLPARFPNILVNGAQGIAVGMATSIPPHNLRETINAAVHLIDNPDASVAQLMKYIKGPDFPLGGRIVTDRTELRKAYESGRGSIKVRGEWKFDKKRRKEIKTRLVIHSIPFDVRSAQLVSDIGDLIESRKLPQLVDVIDETDNKNGLRIVLEIKPKADPEAVISYLYKHTSLEQNFSLNMTCLIPNDEGLTIPQRLDLKEVLQAFLNFRMEVVRRRFEFQLRQLEERIHILEGFTIIFDGLDKALKIIRNSEGKQDAAVKLMKAFPLDEVQTMAILELQLYRISSLEIGRILQELEEKKKEADRIRKILKSKKKLWQVVQSELKEVGETFGERRRTGIGSSEEIQDFDPQAYIVRENTNVVLTQDGWLKRVGRLSNVNSTRTREGDSVLAVVPSSTLDHVIFFSTDGTAYTLPVNQIPASSGYGEPVSKHVKLGDGAKILQAITTDPRFTEEEHLLKGEDLPRPYLLIVTAMGQVMAFPLSSIRVPSTKSGRKYCRLRKGDRVVSVQLVEDAESMFIATEQARVIHFSLDDVPVLSNPGMGVKGIKLQNEDTVLGGCATHTTE